jgi:hypothetical protein
VRLGIDITATTIVAVLDTDPPAPVLFAGAPFLATAVLLAPDATLVVGMDALTGGSAHPHRLVPDPTGLGPDPITVATITVDPTDVATALLHEVASQAGQAVGQRGLGEVTVAVPSGWGPRRRSMLRRAARQAGLGDIRIIDAATAIARHHSSVARPDTDSGVVRVVLVCRRDGVHTEATVLSLRGDEVEVLATSPPNHTTATITEAVDSAADALAAADLTGTDLAGVYCLTTPTDLGPLGTALHQRLGAPVTPLPAGGLAVATAALAAHRPPPSPEARAGRPGWIFAIVRVAVPAAGSVALLAQAIAATDVYTDPADLRQMVVIAEWAAYSTAAVCAVLTGAAIAQVFAQLRPAGSGTRQSGNGLLLAASISIATAVGYALIAATITAAPVTTLLAWTVIPAVVLAAPVGAVSLVLPRTAPGHRSPASFPVSAVALAVLGILAITAADANVPTTPAVLWPVLLRGGGACVGIAVAFMLTARARGRLLVAPLLAATVAAVADLRTATLIGILVTAAVAFWWSVAAARLALAHPAIAAMVRTVGAANAPEPSGPQSPGGMPVGAGPTGSGPDTAGPPIIGPDPTGPDGPGSPPSTSPPAQREPRRFVDQPWAASRDD